MIQKKDNKESELNFSTIHNETMDDVILESILIEVSTERGNIKLLYDKAWFLTSEDKWQCTVDIYGNAGTSQVWIAPRFRISGERINGMCYLTELRMFQINPDNRVHEIPCRVLAVDGESISKNDQLTVDDHGDEMSPDDKAKAAIKMIKSFAAHHNYMIAYSGGKDSVLLAYLVKEANIHAPLIYNNTTIDPPGTISFVRRQGGFINQPIENFFNLVERRGFPTMFRRFCCSELKEKFINEYIMTGVRKSESVKRNKRYCAFEDVFQFTKSLQSVRLHPLLYFTNEDVNYLIQDRQIECHPLYYDSHGVFHVERRLGCIGCPLQGDRGVADFKAYPKFLLQMAKRGIRYHKQHGHTAKDAYENLCYNLFYSNHGYEKYKQAFNGLFENDAKEFLEQQFQIKLP